MGGISPTRVFFLSVVTFLELQSTAKILISLQQQFFPFFSFQAIKFFVLYRFDTDFMIPGKEEFVRLCTSPLSDPTHWKQTVIKLGVYAFRLKFDYFILPHMGIGTLS